MADLEVNILLSNGSRGIRFNIKPYDASYVSLEVAMSFSPFLSTAAVSRNVGLSRASANPNNGLNRFVGDFYNVRLATGRNLLHDASNMNELNEVWGLPFIKVDGFFFADYPPHGLFVQTESAQPFKWRPAGYRSSSMLTDMAFRDSKLDFRGLWRKLEIEDILPFAYSETYTFHLLSSISHEMLLNSYDPAYHYSLLSLESPGLNLTVKLTVLQVRPDLSVGAVFGASKNGADAVCSQAAEFSLLQNAVQTSAFVHLRCLPVDPSCSVHVKVSRFDAALGRFDALSVCRFGISQIEYRALLSNLKPSIGGSSKEYRQDIPPLLKIDLTEYSAVSGEGFPTEKDASNAKDCLGSQTASFTVGSHSDTVAAFSCNPTLEIGINGQCQPRDLLNGVLGCLALLRTDTTKCIKCQTGYFLFNGVCQQCGVGCHLCASSTTCKTCVDGWVFDPVPGSCRKFDILTFPTEFSQSTYSPAFQSMYFSAQTSVDSAVKASTFNGTHFISESSIVTSLNSTVLVHIDLHAVEDVSQAAANSHLEFVLQWNDSIVQTRSVPFQVADFADKVVQFDLVLHDVPAGSHKLRARGLYPFEVKDTRLTVAPYTAPCSLQYQSTMCLVCRDEQLYLKNGQCEPVPLGFISSKVILGGLNQQLVPATLPATPPAVLPTTPPATPPATTLPPTQPAFPMAPSALCTPGVGSCLVCDTAQQSCVGCDQPTVLFQGKCYWPVSISLNFLSPYLFIEFDQEISGPVLKSVLSFAFERSVLFLNESCLEVPAAKVFKCRADKVSNSTFQTLITVTTISTVLDSGYLLPGKSLAAEYNYTSTDPGKSKASQTVGSVASVAVRASMGISLMSMSGSFSQLMKLTQYVELLVYFNVELPENLATFLQYFTEDVLGKLMNPVSDIGMPGCRSPKKFTENGTDCLILQNSGEIFIIFLFIVLTKLMIASLSPRFPFVKKLSEKFNLGLFCMIFDSVAFELMRDSVLNIYMQTFGSIYALINFALSSTVLFAILVMNVWLFRKGTKREKIPHIHDGYDFEKFTGRYNIPIQQVISLACILIIILGYSHPFFHILSIGSLNLSVWAVHTLIRPQVTRFEYGKALLTNLVISGCMLGMISFSKEARLNTASRSLVGLFMIIGLSAVFGLTILSNLLQAVKGAISFYKSTHKTTGTLTSVKTRKVVRKTAPKKKKRVPLKIKQLPDTDGSLWPGQITESNHQYGSSQKIEIRPNGQRSQIHHRPKLNLPKIILPKQTTPPKSESFRLRDSPQKLSSKLHSNRNLLNQSANSSTVVIKTLKTKKVFFSSDGIKL